MFIDFDEVFNKENGTPINIPEPLLTYLSKDLPQGLQYIADETGYCVVSSMDGSDVKLSGFSLEPTSEQKIVLGENATIEEIISYSYNAQQNIPIKLNREGYIKLNGKEISVERLQFNPFYENRYVPGSFEMKPSEFPEPFEINIGYEETERKITISRIANESVNIAAYESKKENEPLYIKFYVNEKENTLQLSIGMELKYAKDVKELLEVLAIYKAFLEGRGVILNEEVTGTPDNWEHTGFDEKIEIFWNKVLNIEQYLNVRFQIPRDEVDIESRVFVEKIYQNLIKKKPVRENKGINKATGEWTFKKEDEVWNFIGKVLYFQFEATEVCTLFGVDIELPCIVGLYNARLVNIEQADGKYDVIFENESEEHKMYMTSLCFKDKVELRKYKEMNEGHISETFHSAKDVIEYLNELHVKQKEASAE